MIEQAINEAAAQAKLRGMTLHQWVNLCMTAWEKLRETSHPPKS